MKKQPERRSNAARTAATKTSLIEAARTCFAENGYAATSTPQIVRAAQVTRGALYHHFRDKLDLFRAVLRAEAELVAHEIETRAATHEAPVAALAAGAEAYFRAMAAPGRARLLLVEGPSVVGEGEMTDLDEDTGAGTLRRGLGSALGDAVDERELAALASMLSAAFDRAALRIADGAAPEPFDRGIRRLLDGLLASAQEH